MPSLPQSPLRLLSHTNTYKEESAVFSFYGLYAWKVFEDLCRRIYFPIEPVSKDQLVLFYGTVSSIARSVDLPKEHQFNEQELELTRRLCEEKFLQGVQTYEVMALPNRERIFALYLAVSFLMSNMEKMEVVEEAHMQGPRLTIYPIDNPCSKRSRIESTMDFNIGCCQTLYSTRLPP